MRGKGFRAFPSTSVSRITPAYAGKSFNQLEMSENRGDHPRLCGEKSEAVKLYITHLGSPPPMRGKDTILQQITVHSGITPAYAGKRKGTFAGMIPCEDHPRLCGEKAPHRAGKTVLLGSPPPMRGKEPQNVTSIKFYRITPAYAGKRSSGTG